MMKAAPKTGVNLPGDAPLMDPEFADELGSGSGIDPEAQDFHDAMDVNGATSQHGVVLGIDAELKEQQRQVEADTLEVLDALRALDAGETVTWRITRKGTGDPQLDGFLDTWPSSLMTLERIRDKMGGGTFYLKGFRNNKYWVHKTVTIAGVPKLYRKDEAGRVDTPLGTTAGFDVQGFLAQQAVRDAQLRREQEEREQKARREREEQDEKQQARTERMLALILPVVGTIGAALTTAFGGRQDNTAALIAAVKGPDPLTLLTQLKALQGNGQDQTLNRILPMLIDMAGSKAAGGDTGWLDVIKEFAKGAGPAVGSLIQHQLTQPPAAPGMSVLPVTGPSNPPLTGALPAPSMNSMPATDGTSRSSMLVVPESMPRRERRTRTAPDPSIAEPPAAPRPGRSVPIAGSPSPSNPGSGEMNLLSLLPHLPWLKEMLGRLLAAAARGKDPEVYAALFLEEVPEEINAEQIVGLLAPENWFQQLCQLEPRWNDARVYPWIEHVRGLILQQLVPSAGVAPVPAGQGAAMGTAHGSAGPAVSQATAPSPAPVRQRGSAEVERPRKLPSLTGD